MGFFLKLFSVIFSCILPKTEFNRLMFKVRETKKIMNRTPQLKLLTFILTYPVVIVCDLIVSIVKLIMVWFLPSQLYGDLHYTFQLFVKDLTEDHKPIKLALKRTLLCLELFTKGAEKTRSFGKKNPDKTFFVIRPYYFDKPNELYPSDSHLMFHYYRNLQHLSKAVNHGWIPVVDWQNYGKLAHAEDFPINGTTNSWEYFWTQPSEYSLEEVYQSKNVILSSQNSVSYGYIPSMLLQPPFAEYAKLLAEKCPRYDSLITLNEPTAKYIDEKMSILFPKGKRIMGVSIRATSYGVQHISRHPRQPTLDDVIDTVVEKAAEWNMDYVFFACEAEAAVEKMKSRFGDRLITLPRMRYKEMPKIGENPLYAPGQKYQTNLDYLTEMVLLSRCTSLIAGISGGVRMAIIWNADKAEKYEHIHIFETGLWN